MLKRVNSFGVKITGFTVEAEERTGIFFSFLSFDAHASLIEGFIY